MSDACALGSETVCFWFNVAVLAIAGLVAVLAAAAFHRIQVREWELHYGSRAAAQPKEEKS